MKKGRIFRISSFLAAGLLPGKALAAFSPDLNTKTDPSSLFDVFKRSQHMIISGHRSHSSHASHRSHRSSSGGGYTVPRVYSPPSVNRRLPPVNANPAPAAPQPPPAALKSDSTAPSSVLPTPQRAAPQNSRDVLPEEVTEKFKQRVRVVQLALFSYGYYMGEVDGIMGPQTSVAISKLQTDYGLNVTGTITPELLKALGIHGQ